MCLFITAGFALSAQQTLEQLATGRPPLGFHAVHNSSVERSLHPGELYLRATARHCDCDTALGMRSRNPGHTEDLESQVRKLRRQGWTEKKIQRALDDKRRAADAHQRHREETAEHQSEIRSWRSFLGDVVGGHRRGTAALLIHLYSGALDEPIDYAEEEVLLRDISDEWLLSIREDALYRVIS